MITTGCWNRLTPNAHTIPWTAYTLHEILLQAHHMNSNSDYFNPELWDTHKVQTTISNSPSNFITNRSKISNSSSPQTPLAGFCHELLCTSELLQPDELDPAASRNYQYHLFEEVHRHRKHSQQQQLRISLAAASPISPPDYQVPVSVSLSLSLSLCFLSLGQVVAAASCLPAAASRRWKGY